MFSVQALLAKKIAEQLPTYVYIAFGVILGLAFIIGFCKGYRKISRSNIYWAIAGVGFVFVYKFLNKKNPLDKLFKGSSAGLADGVWAVALAVACALVALLFYGAITAMCKPKPEYIKDCVTEDYWFEYDVDDVDDMPAGYGRRRHELQRKKYRPSIGGRIMGAIACTLNAAVALAALAALVLVIFNGSTFSKGVLSGVFDIKFVKSALKYLAPYTMDVLCVGIIFGFGYLGYNKGFLGSARVVIKVVGTLAVVGFCFAIPFIGKLADMKYFALLIEKCSKLFSKLDGKLGEIAGKLTAGAVMAIAAVIVIVLLCLLLKSLTYKVETTSVTRAIDGALAALVYALIGVAVCAILWGGLYIVDYCDLFTASKLCSNKPTMANEFFAIAEKYLEKYADKWLLKFKG